MTREVKSALNTFLMACSVLTPMAMAMWGVVSAMNSAYAAEAMAAEAKAMVNSINDKINGIDVIQEQVQRLRQDIDEIQTSQTTSNSQYNRKLDKIIEKLDAE